jgi:hypothetical protein
VARKRLESPGEIPEFDYGLFGPVAHLVERFHGMEEVRGSIPLRSTVNTFCGMVLAVSYTTLGRL